jgi:hypothetical protein
MILANQPRIFDAEAFSIAMSRAMRAVVRLAVPGQATGRATGWVLTPQLVVDAGVCCARREHRKVRRSGGCRGQGVLGDRNRWPAGGSRPAAKKGFALVLLRLKTPKRLPRLDFGVSLPPAKSYVSLLSYAGGELEEPVLLSPAQAGRLAETRSCPTMQTAQGGVGRTDLRLREWRARWHQSDDGEFRGRAEPRQTTASRPMDREASSWPRTSELGAE